MPYEDEDLLEELVTESNEHLTAIEPDLLALEKEGDQVSSDLVNRVFRAMHSIKGGFSFFGLSHIVDLSHSMESVLMLIRDGEISVTSEITDALLGGVDKLRSLLKDVSASESTSIQEELDPLTAILQVKTEGGVASKAASGPQSATVGGSPEPGDSQEEAEAVAEQLSQSTEGTRSPEAEKTTIPAVSSEKTLVETASSSAEPVANNTPPPTTARRDKHAEGSESIRVKVGLLDNLMNLAGELVLGRNQIKIAISRRFSDAAAAGSALKHIETELSRAQASILALVESRNGADSTAGNKAQQAGIIREFTEIKNALQQIMSMRLIEIPGMSTVMQDINLVTSELQNGIMNTRMQPVGTVFAKFPRIMRDLSKKMGKEIELELIGQDVELDKSIIEALGDPLTHLVRNCADHGIESTDERDRLGKPRQGKVRLRAYHEGGQVNIDITDDGRGINVERIKNKALERGILTEDASKRMTDREAVYLIFAPGFSMAEQISDISGRGVGMDVVKTNIENLGGTVEIESVCGEGTRINLRLPLTLAIIPSLIVGAGGRRYAIPQVNLEELVIVHRQDKDKRIEEIQGNMVLRLRGKLLALITLTDLLNIQSEELIAVPGMRDDDPSPESDSGATSAQKILILKVGTNCYGLIVEELFDSEEIVVKPLSCYLKECKHYAGSTIMGDGRVAMILDVAGIADTAQLKFSDISDEKTQTARKQREIDVEMQPLLLFRNGTSELFALSLALIGRIEKVRASDIEHVGTKEYVKYDHSSMRIIHLHDILPITPREEEPDHFYIIVPKVVKHPMGIVATKVEDILHTDAEIDQINISGQGILGSAVLGGQLTVFLDIYGLFEAVAPEEYGIDRDSPIEALRGLRVLIAEDTSFFRSVESEYLRSLGCIVDTAVDGMEAWGKLSDGTYDALVTDIEMPKMDGFELIERVRASSQLKNLPVIGVTALRSDDVHCRAIDAGVDAMETKLDKGRMLEALANAIQKRSKKQKWIDNSQPSSSEMPASA
ncbi:MAG: chemotaxis protein CheW [Candidatus Eisenbacteria sp.]|nr:chemotaxis protein CheW [Candidatus Eisenbacteria bacterium]